MRRTLDIDHFRMRVLQDALTEALPAYWLRRAAQFDGCGTQTAADTALACRRHAWLLEREGAPQHMLHELVAALEDADTETGTEAV